MMFTPQQLRGAGRYNAKTRVGNWNEDQRLQETRVAEYKMKQERGMLATQKMNRKLGTLNQKVPRTYSLDGNLHFGACVSFLSLEAEAVVSVDIFEETALGTKEYIVTAAKEGKEPMARNTFRIVHPGNTDRNESSKREPLRFGDPFYLVCNDSLRVAEGSAFLTPPMYLKSILKSEKRSSPVSDQQQVFLSLGADSNALWRILKTADGANGGSERVLAEGLPVAANEAVIIQHKMTGKALFCSKEHHQSTNCGNEFEISCHNSHAAGRSHNLRKEFHGLTTSDSGARAELLFNHFKVLTAATPAQAIDTQQLPPEPTVSGMCRKICEQITENAIHGLRTFVNLNRQYVESGRGYVDREDMKFALMDLGVRLTVEQIDILLDHFDKRKDGMLAFEEIRIALRGGQIAEGRREVINTVYDDIERQAEGQKVTMAVLLDLYDAKGYVPVHGGKYSEDAIREDFVQAWGPHTLSDRVTRQMFADFYRDVSPIIAEDLTFDRMLTSCWLSRISKK